MDEQTEKQKELLIKSILEQYSQNNVNIQYSSLWAAKYGMSKLIWPIRIISSLLTVIPIVLILLRNGGIIDSSNQSVLWIIIICLSISAIVLVINPDWMKSVLAMKRKQAQELLDLNKKLQMYEYKLEGLYNNVLASKTNIDVLQSKFDALRNEYINEVGLHDELTGKLDEQLQKEAQKRTYEIMDIKKLVIYE